MTTRSLGREDVTVETALVAVPVHRTDGTPPIFAGFRQHWMDGTDDERSARFSMQAGAGLGSPYITIEVTKADGTTVHEYMDVRDLLTARVEAILNER